MGKTFSGNCAFNFHVNLNIPHVSWLDSLVTIHDPYIGKGVLILLEFEVAYLSAIVIKGNVT